MTPFYVQSERLRILRIVTRRKEWAKYYDWTTLRKYTTVLHITVPSVYTNRAAITFFFFFFFQSTSLRFFFFFLRFTFTVNIEDNSTTSGSGHGTARVSQPVRFDVDISGTRAIVPLSISREN
ncbi:unnamed protein product [Ixodes pacificus]